MVMKRGCYLVQHTELWGWPCAFKNSKRSNFRIIHFGLLKERVGKWLSAHALLYHPG